MVVAGIDAATLSAILLAVVGGGGIVPFAWRLWVKRHPNSEQGAKNRAEIESISAHAASETIDAMKGAMGFLRQQLIDGKQENDTLRGELEANRTKIETLEGRVESLTAEVRRLGGSFHDLPCQPDEA